MPRGNLQDSDEAVARHERRAQHRRFPYVFAVSAVAAVVVEPLGEICDRFARPLVPVVAASIEAVDPPRLEHLPDAVAEREAKTDAMALRLRPRNLFRDDLQLLIVLVTNQQRRRVIVVREGPETVQNLIEQVLRMELFHDLAIDPIAHAEHPLPVHVLDRIRDDGDDAHEESAIVPLIGTPRTPKGERRPRAVPPPNRRHDEVFLPGRMLVPNELREDLEVPLAVSGYLEEQAGAGQPVSAHGDAAVGGFQQLEYVAERMAQRLLWILRALQMLGKPVEELEGLEFLFWRQHRVTVSVSIQRVSAKADHHFVIHGSGRSAR